MSLFSFKSRIAGRNATVEIHEDRIEWIRTGHSIPAILWTFGLILLVTPRAHTEMIPLRMVTSISSAPSGLLNDELRVSTATNTINLRASKANASRAKDIIQSRLLALK